MQNPAPDNDTMLTLIETNDQLALAMSKHQRAILQARKSVGPKTENGHSPSNETPDSNSSYGPPSGPPPTSTKPTMLPQNQISVPAHPSIQERKRMPERINVSTNLYARLKPEDPFKDPVTTTMPNMPFPTDQQPPTDQFFDRLGVEPYHPGFSPTNSYMTRQESAIGKVTMHATGPAVLENDSAEKEVVEQNHIPEEDSYDVSPIQQKAPIYRY